MKKILGRSAIGLALVFLLIQLVPVDRSNPPVVSEVFAPEPVKAILRKACYDCHSHETRWPWYSRIAPVSWLMAEHVEDGRKDMNLSRWPLLDMEAQADILEDIEEEIAEDEMPLWSYRLGHPEARLTDEEKAVLLRWARAR